MSHFLIKSDKKSKKKNKKIYNSSIAKSIRDVERKQARKLKETGFSSQFDTLMLDNFNAEPVGVNQSNVIKRGDSVSYDTSLQRDIDFVRGYSEFGPTQMHYDVVPEFEMMISNMNPHSQKRDITQYNNDYSHKLAINTGTDPYYRSKTEGFEPVSLFEPEKDLTFVNGAPVQTHILEERYLPSTKNNNGDLPFDNNLKVLPGLFGENLPANTIYRCLPKETNELRSKTNKKITYEADKVEAVKKGERRGLLSKQTKFKKKPYRDRDMKDYLPNSAPANKRMLRGKYKKPNTKRSVSKSVMGGAYRPEVGKKHIGKFTESSKTTFANQERGVTNQSFKPVHRAKNSYRNTENERSSTNHNTPGGIYKPNSGAYAINPNDIPLTTLRQLMIEGDTNIGITSQKNNNYVFSKDNVLPENNRSYTVINKNEGNVTSRNKSGYTFNKADKPRETIKETTINNNYISTIQPTNKGTYYFNENDTAKSTIRQTTSHANREGTVNTGSKQTYYFNKNDKPKDTIRQTTGLLSHQGALSGGNSSYYFDKNDKPKETIKQSTSLMTVQPTMQADFHAPNYVNYNDKPGKTLKETTELMTHQGVINVGNKKGHYFNKKDKARPTIKENTVINMVHPNLQNESGTATYINNNQKANPTIRETTGLVNRVGNNTNSNSGLYILNKDKARETIKETTIFNNYDTGVADLNKGHYIINPEDKPSTTLKESILHPNREANVRNNQQSYAMNYNDKARPTIRNSTLHSTQEGRVGTSNGSTYARDTKDIARPTIKYSTLHSTQGGRIGREGGERKYFRSKDDKARETIKETTLHSSQIRIGRESGETSYFRGKNDKARATLKQTTLLQNHTGPLGAVVEKKHATQDAEHNMVIDDRRQTLTYSRPAGPRSDRSGPILVRESVKLKEENFLNRENYGYDRSAVNQGHLSKRFTRNKEILNNPNYRINDNFINTLHTNPLVNDLMHQKR